MSLFGYLLQYRFKDMAELLANEKKEPLECTDSLAGKTAVISGATSGIGLETARLFASKGASIVLLNRNPEKSRVLEEELRKGHSCKVRTILADFSSLDETKRCARELLALDTPIDILIHNSGVFYTRKTITSDGNEMVFQVNHLSSFCLNYLLKEKLKDEGRVRIIYVNSEGHRFALAGVHLNDLHWKRHLYSGLKSYGAAKTAQLLTLQGFNHYFMGTGVTVNAMHPGNVCSNIGENNGTLYRRFKDKIILKSAKDPLVSAKALYYLSVSKELDGISGKFFNLTSPERPAPHGRDARKVDDVWEKSLELCGLK
ncbi:MAG: SDR family NAD(P)-dependent oxidoreductase [Spirochaetales bacterium]|nr:SDR family NAD(P)-dependent oxidoreductase [Spirochaetales bacterium]